jgi:hypothetical protein
MVIKSLMLMGLALAAGAARAQPVGGLPRVYGRYAGCLDGLAARTAYAPLAGAGFFGDGGTAGGVFVTPAQAVLVARYQADAATCQVELRTALENVDANLADLATQERQLSDVNELLLVDRAEDWAAYRLNRRRIETDFWRAARAAVPRDDTGAAETAQDDPSAPDTELN